MSQPFYIFAVKKLKTMKKITKILFVLMFIASFKMLSVSNNLTVTPHTDNHVVICQGTESQITIQLKVKYTGDFDTSALLNVICVRLEFEFHYVTPIIPLSSIFSMPKTFNGTDTIYYYTFAYTPTINVGTYLLYIAPYNESNPAVILEIVECVGIKKYEFIAKEEKPIYYDLSGNIIDPRTNELMIMKIGNKRKKVIILP